jgi:phosphatidylinositol glycan class B
MHFDGGNSRWLWKWMGISLFLHLLAVFFSAGFQNSDEHFQILEFLGYWLGKSPASDLSVEFHRQMRPWLQVFLYWLPVRGLRFLGVESPFVWAASIRLLSALIGWSSVVFLALRARSWIEDTLGYRFAVLGLCLSWFVPALHARHSSENLSGAVLVLALCAATGRVRQRFVLAGILTGLAFELRYQVGVMGLGLFAWLVFASGLTRRLRMALQFVSGALIALALGVVCDRIGYGQWVVAPWNYFKFNLLEGQLDAAGVYPFWDYFRRMWTESVPGLAFISILGLILSWVSTPLSPLTWAMAPFFLFHVAMGHKETRFLFPMAHVAPVALAQALFPLRESRWRWSWSRLRDYRLIRYTAYGVVGFNLIVLSGMVFLPALASMRFFAAVHEVASEVRPLRLHLGEQDPYVFGGIRMNFYRPAGLELVRGAGVQTGNAGVGVVQWWALPRADRVPCEIHTATYPEWVGRLIGKSRYNSIRNWTLFRCSGHPFAAQEAVSKPALDNKRQQASGPNGVPAAAGKQ